MDMQKAVNQTLAKISMNTSTSSSEITVGGNVKIDLVNMEAKLIKPTHPNDRAYVKKSVEVLNACFRVTDEWITVFLQLAKTREMNGQEIYERVLKAVDGITFSSPTPAEVLGERKTVKLYSYHEVEYLVHSGKASYKEFGIVRYPEDGVGVIFGKIAEMSLANIPILPPKKL